MRRADNLDSDAEKGYLASDASGSKGNAADDSSARVMRPRRSASPELQYPKAGSSDTGGEGAAWSVNIEDKRHSRESPRERRRSASPEGDSVKQGHKDTASHVPRVVHHRPTSPLRPRVRAGCCSPARPRGPKVPPAVSYPNRSPGRSRPIRAQDEACESDSRLMSSPVAVRRERAQGVRPRALSGPLTSSCSPLRGRGVVGAECTVSSTRSQGEEEGSPPPRSPTRSRLGLGVEGGTLFQGEGPVSVGTRGPKSPSRSRFWSTCAAEPTPAPIRSRSGLGDPRFLLELKEEEEEARAASAARLGSPARAHGSGVVARVSSPARVHASGRGAAGANRGGTGPQHPRHGRRSTDAGSGARPGPLGEVPTHGLTPGQHTSRPGGSAAFGRSAAPGSMDETFAPGSITLKVWGCDVSEDMTSPLAEEGDALGNAGKHGSVTLKAWAGSVPADELFEGSGKGRRKLGHGAKAVLCDQGEKKFVAWRDCLEGSKDPWAAAELGEDGSCFQEACEI